MTAVKDLSDGVVLKQRAELAGSLSPESSTPVAVGVKDIHPPRNRVVRRVGGELDQRNVPSPAAKVPLEVYHEVPDGASLHGLGKPARCQLDVFRSLTEGGSVRSVRDRRERCHLVECRGTLRGELLSVLSERSHGG